MNSNWSAMLDVASALILFGLFLLGAYETLAIINIHVAFTPDLPLITDIVRPWVHAHMLLALTIASVVVGAFFWLFFHFFLGN